MIQNPILERDATIVKNSYGAVSQLKRGDAFRIGESYYVVVGNDYFERFAAEKSKKINPQPSPYKQFYQSNMRPRR